MGPVLDKTLCARYPLIFSERHGDPSATAMCRGFEFEDGWLTLIDVLCRELQRETEEQDAPQIVAKQVKQKGGELRFYVAAASDRQRAMIDFAQAMSRNLCELCGRLGPPDEIRVARMPIHCPACRVSRGGE